MQVMIQITCLFLQSIPLQPLLENEQPNKQTDVTKQSTVSLSKDTLIDMSIMRVSFAPLSVMYMYFQRNGLVNLFTTAL